MPDASFTCGLCAHRIDVANAENDARTYESRKWAMSQHYKFEHPERFGVKRSQPGVAFSDYWEFGPIPDDIGPVLHYDSQTYPWSQA